jgi:hypothetical protein
MANESVRLGELINKGEDHFVVACEPCKRTGRYNVARLIETHGRDAALPDVLGYLTRTCNQPSAAGSRRWHAIYQPGLG